MTLRSKTQALLETKAQIRKMGGAEELAKQKAAGKLNARERVDLFFDKGTFTETGILGTTLSDAQLKNKPTPADGVITGFGLVHGRRVYVIAYDFTVLAGTIGEVNERKAQRIRDMAFSNRCPLVWLLDSAGARVQEIAGSRFAETGKLFHDQIQYSGVVPQIAAVMGPCAAGTAYIPALADFIPMVKGTSSMALAGPPLVKAAIGEDISVEDLGGSRVHCEVSGVADVECADDKDCLETIKKYLSYFPSHCGEKPPVIESQGSGKISESERMARLMAGETLTGDRISDDILDILPEKSNQPYDMRKIIEKLVDGGETLEMKPKFGQAIITALARLGGQSVGIVASQPMFRGGVLDIDESDKSARFMNLCDAYTIPLVFLQDLPGFMVGSAVEKRGIIRHGAKMLYAMSRASVPKLTVIVRKAYGAGYYALCGRAFGADLVVAWPTAEISLMGAEGAVNIVFRREIEKSPDPDKRRAELIDMYRKKIALEIAAGGSYIDDVIDPRDTRRILIETLKMTANKTLNLPIKKHGVMPV